MISQFGAFTSYQVNVDAAGNNITGDAANEPSLSVDPTDHNRMVIGWRQFDTVLSNFRTGGWAYTNNGGTSWMFQGVLDGVFRSDPVLSCDSVGNFFYLSLLTNFLTDVWRSTDHGAIWGRIAPARGGDKQWYAIDRGTSTGHGFQYECWSSVPEGNTFGGRQFTRSTDGGMTWLNPVNIPNFPSLGTMDIDSNGNVFIVGKNFNTEQIWCERSTNAKNAAATPSFDQSTLVNLGGIQLGGEPINPVGTVGQLNVAVDRSGTSSNNNVYILCSVRPSGASTGSEVMFARSTDSGHTFSAPHRINDDPVDQNKWHWLAALSVAPNGRLDAVWFDTRNAINNTDSQLFYSYSTDVGNTWSPNVPVSPPFDPFIGYPNQEKIGDYITIVSDSTGGDVAYAATFNGEQDIYYVRVAPLTSPLLNISTRLRVLADDDVLIAGFIITGNAPKRVIVRGIGPSLSSFGITGVLADPTLELHQGATTLATNDNWKVRSDGTDQQAEVEATTIPPTNDLESAIVMTLDPGSYTAVLSGKNGGTGVGVVEVYDLAPAANSQLANISTRGLVDTGDNVMIGGFIIGGGSSTGGRAIIRAIGPSLGNFNIQGALQDPMLELHDANGTTIATNDDWKNSDLAGQTQENEVRATTIAPSDDRESAIVASFRPGPYTAIVRGKNNTTGVALVECYTLP